MSEDEYRAIREGKRDALAALGLNPYEVRTPARELAAALIDQFKQRERLSGDEPLVVATVGTIRTAPRLTEWGVYFDLSPMDESEAEAIQIAAKTDVLDESVKKQLLESTKVGHFVAVSGLLSFEGAGRPTVYLQRLLMWSPSSVTTHATPQLAAAVERSHLDIVSTRFNEIGFVASVPQLLRVTKRYFDDRGVITPQSDVRLEGRAIAGRVLANRKMGKKAIFLDVYDGSGKLQVYMNEKGIGEQGMAIYENLDLGDFVWVRGDVQRTRTGEITLFAAELRFLTKALSVPPLPREFTDEEGNKKSVDALTDPELRHRKRYLDLMVHAEVRERFEQRSQVLTTIRHYLEAERFLEVETPMMHPVPGGARARPFITHHNALGMNLYLRIAPELYLKRLLVGGFERVFEVNRNFRNEGIDHTHNPEFTMLELYEAYADYERMMELTEGMIVAAAKALRGNDELSFEWNGHKIDLTPPFRRAKYADLFREATGFDMTEREKVAAEAKKLEIDPKQDYWNTVNEILEHHVEPTLIQPTFLIDYPTAICPLTKAKPDQPDIAERFELFIGGIEFANAFSELNEPVEQLRRFNEQVELGKTSQDVEAPKEVDYDYVEALEAGMPPAGGLGVGIDRLVMLLTGTDSIREVILFPHMRREHINQQDASVQRARIAIESVLEELDSPELRKIEGLHQLKERFEELVGQARLLLGDTKKETKPG